MDLLKPLIELSKGRKRGVSMRRGKITNCRLIKSQRVHNHRIKSCEQLILLLPICTGQTSDVTAYERLGTGGRVSEQKIRFPLFFPEITGSHQTINLVKRSKSNVDAPGRGIKRQRGEEPREEKESTLARNESDFSSFSKKELVFRTSSSLSLFFCKRLAKERTNSEISPQLS